MHADFHYYATAWLCRAAGFQRDHAATIAYACAYVDDARDHQPIHVPGTKECVFDPTCTSRLDITCFDWNVQRKIYMPFHFLPDMPPTSDERAWTCVPEGCLANHLLRRALDDRNLMSIGIALHAYADQWAHAGFSGRRHLENHRDTPLGILAPAIGHAEAGDEPDDLYRRIDYFVGCARRIHQILREYQQNSAIPFDVLAGPMEDLMEERGSVEGRCKQWRDLMLDLEVFAPPELIPYDPGVWKSEALSSRTPEAFYQSRWVRWHRAAATHRYRFLDKTFL